jgi:hypothetical protein
MSRDGSDDAGISTKPRKSNLKGSAGSFDRLYENNLFFLADYHAPTHY